MLIILFGKPGVGKTHIGKLLQAQYGYFFYDADIDLTPAALTAIQKEEIFSPAVENEFAEVVIARIKQLQKKHKSLIVAQAFGREVPRAKLFNTFEDAQFYFIEIPYELANQRLSARKDWVNIGYAGKIRQAYELPQVTHRVIDNSKDDAYVLQQFRQFL
ncbi:MAG: guanylate kinase [Gammaproteobacteria bacterium]|jgi:shikimate kinase|nr:guanylate kinase [Gammaproteobacteria bacterium]